MNLTDIIAYEAINGQETDELDEFGLPIAQSEWEEDDYDFWINAISHMIPED